MVALYLSSDRLYRYRHDLRTLQTYYEGFVLHALSAKVSRVPGLSRSHHSIVSLARRVDIDEALEEGPFRNTDPLCNDIPNQGTFIADVHTVAAINVAMHCSQDHHFTGTDISRHLPIAANRDRQPGK